MKRLDGFSLLELMIATVLGAMLLMTASTMFMVFMTGSASTNARRQVSAEGQQLLGTIQFHARNARDCELVGSNGVRLTKVDNTQLTFCVESVGAGDVRMTLNQVQPIPTCSSSEGDALNSRFVISQSSGDPYFSCTSDPTTGKKTLKSMFELKVREDSSIREKFTTQSVLRNS